MNAELTLSQRVKAAGFTRRKTEKVASGLIPEEKDDARFEKTSLRSTAEGTQ